MTEVNTIREAYQILNPMKLHKFGTSYSTAVAFVLAPSQEHATKLIKARMPDVDHPTLTYLGAKALTELGPCVMLNQFPVF